MTNMRTNQLNGIGINGQGLRESVLGRSLEMNTKLIRNAMFVTVIIVVISVMGKASAHDGVTESIVSADHADWVVVADR